MSNDTTVSTSAVGGALGILVVFVANKLGAGLGAEEGAAIAVVLTAVLGSVLPR